MENLTHSLKNDLYLIFQPIIHILSDEINEVKEFEVLLRSKKTQSYPKDLMDKFILEDESNKQLLAWYHQELIHYFEKHPTYVFNFNIHPQQCLHPSTWEFLEHMQEYSKRINIELTEKPMTIAIDEECHQKCMQSYICKIAQMGYHLSFDDIGSGQNTLELVSSNIESIDCLKFSLRSFNQADKKTIRMFLDAWLHLANKHQVRMVVEGIEDKEISLDLAQQGIKWQQGYYWSRAVNL